MRFTNQQNLQLLAWLEKNFESIAALNLTAVEVTSMASEELGFHVSCSQLCHRMGPQVPTKFKHTWPGSDQTKKCRHSTTQKVLLPLFKQVEAIRFELGMGAVEGWKESLSWIMGDGGTDGS